MPHKIGTAWMALLKSPISRLRCQNLDDLRRRVITGVSLRVFKGNDAAPEWDLPTIVQFDLDLVKILEQTQCVNRIVRIVFQYLSDMVSEFFQRPIAVLPISANPRQFLTC